MSLDQVEFIPEEDYEIIKKYLSGGVQGQKILLPESKRDEFSEEAINDLDKGYQTDDADIWVELPMETSLDKHPVFDFLEESESVIEAKETLRESESTDSDETQVKEEKNV